MPKTMVSLSIPAALPIFESSFVDLPEELLDKIRNLLGPKDSLRVAVTCTKFNRIFGYSAEWNKWLRSEYENKRPSEFSLAVFKLEVRKQYGFTFQRPITSLRSEVNDLLSKSLIDKKDVPFLTPFELSHFYSRFNKDNIDKLRKQGRLSVENIRNLSINQVNRLSRDNICKLFKLNLLPLKVIETLSKRQFDALCKGSICKLFANGLVSLEEIDSLSDRQIYRLWQEKHICELFANARLSLEEIENLTDKQFRRISDYYIIYNLFEDGDLSLEEIEGLTDKQMEGLREDCIKRLVWDRRLSLQELASLTDNQFNILCDKYNIFSLFRNGLLSLEGIENLTKKQIEWLSGEKIENPLECFSSVSDREGERYEQKNEFLSDTINDLFENGLLSLDAIECLTYRQVNWLCVEKIGTLYRKGRLSLEEIGNFTRSRFEQLCKDDTFQVFIESQLSLDQFLPLEKGEDSPSPRKY